MDSVLIVEDRGIGDLLVCTPVFRALKQHFRQVDVLVKKGMEEVLQGNHNVDRVITSLQDDYDLCVLLNARSRGSHFNATLLRRHCRFRIGFARNALFEKNSGFFLGLTLHRKVWPNFKVQHKIQDNLDVIRSVGIDGNDRIDVFTDFSPQLSNYVVFHIHGDRRLHNWYPERWAYLAESVSERIVFTGTDSNYAQEIIKIINKPIVNATSVSIQEYFGWIKYAKYVITVDTSAVHVASGFNTPIFCLFGPGDPRVWGPRGDFAKVITAGRCHSCRSLRCCRGDHQCMTEIRVRNVVDELNQAVLNPLNSIRVQPKGEVLV